MSWVAIGVGVVGAAGTAYSASQAGDAAGSAPVPNNPGASLLKYIKGLKAGLPDLTTLESEYRPQYGQLNIADQKQYLNALLGFGGTAQGSAADQIAAARQRELGEMGGNVPAVLGILGGIDPRGQAASMRATQMADDAYARSQGLTFQEKRASDQQAREAFGARGRLNDTASVASEILGREDVLARKRGEAADMNAGAFAINQQFTSPAMSLLSMAPASTALGMDYLGASQGIIGQNTPQLINPDAGINLGMANASNLAAYQQAQATAKAGQAGMYGQLGSSLLGLAGTLAKR